MHPPTLYDRLQGRGTDGAGRGRAESGWVAGAGWYNSDSLGWYKGRGGEPGSDGNRRNFQWPVGATQWSMRKKRRAM
eukprot:757429-Hanusia_phi.AAC.1